ncbi:hypothetical protein BC351_04000 [Paenibacillus ferrarius]|uniref:Copper amine oxidase-like N-terminal domain-containing protein n=1 Tax=Paenibacillus ferrarius TaxID=1469647 RepID=A0A1V4HLE5_9BACL|nr:hypothetical protein [Paenibacillus ferrarius]OPH57686.1 hypothetical protein BC351_04000 [Paenibacillus ferrarius]
MKRLMSLIVIFCIVALAIVPVSAFAKDSEYEVYVNNKLMKSEYPPISHNNAVYVPLWSLLGQLNMSAKDYSGVLRINHPYRTLLVKADQNMMTYFGRNMDIKYARLEYPIITQDYVMYVPLVFLGDYLDMKIAYGENGRIDITSADLSKDVSWGKDYDIEKAAKQLNLDAAAEGIWKTNSSLWNKKTYFGGHSSKKNYLENSVVSYSGATVTLANSLETYTVTFSSLEDIVNALTNVDPFDGLGWSKDTIDMIKDGYVKIGMTKLMARYSWGAPDKVNKYSSKYSYSEQWVYNYTSSMSFLYFDEDGKLTNIQN